MELTDTNNIPYSLGDVTSEWLTNALREQGLLGTGTVTEFTHQTVGEEAGFNGDVAILKLTYSDDAHEAPASMVLKIPTASKNRIMGQTMGLYEKEIRFYRDLEPLLKVRVPKHYYSAVDAVDDPDMVLERLEGLNNLPVFVVRFLTTALTWFIKMTPRRYALLIEDLSAYRLGDQMASYSDQDMQHILTAMAKLHAQFWDSAELKSMTWIHPLTATSRIIQGMFLGSVKKFRNSAGEQLSDRHQALINWLCEHGVELTEILGQEVQTLLHGDFRLDNICFNDDAGEVLLMDWQTMQRGAAGMDLAYFMSAALPADASESEINAMIDVYHQALTAEGIDLPRERLQWQYEVGTLAMLHRILPAMFQGNMELGEGRGREMIQAWIDKTFNKAIPIEFETILDRAPSVPG